MEPVLKFDFSAYECEATWRYIEQQSGSNTYKLVGNSGDKHEILELMIEESKEKLPDDRLDYFYLLFTPFRYSPPYPGSRFRASGPYSGMYYAAEDRLTAMYEDAYYLYRRYMDSPDAGFPADVKRTAISIGMKTERCIDLTIPPLVENTDKWMALDDYTYCQELGAAALEAEAQIIRYSSVRDPEQRPCVAAMTPEVFTAAMPRQMETWSYNFTRGSLEAYCETTRSRYTLPLG